VFETGRLVVEGRASDLLQDDAMRSAYLGKSAGKTAGMSSVEAAFATAEATPDGGPATTEGSTRVQ
jgi:hypothetical protein